MKTFVNIRLLEFAAYLGNKYGARVTSWGRDSRGNREVGGSERSWHLWERGANAIDLAPHCPKDYLKARLGSMAKEAREAGFQAIVYADRGFMHIEEPW